MAHWIRFAHAAGEGFGTLAGERVHVHAGDMFDGPSPTGATLRLADVRLLPPCRPGKIVALWNNFHALAAKLGNPVPPEPLWFLKSTTAVIGPGETIRRPAHFEGKVIFEGELGIVIGRRASGVTEAEAPAHVFGYTCVNDVTAVDLLKKDATFDQWSRAKSFDTFCPLGPAIATDVDPGVLEVRVVLNGEERQRYPVADIVFPPARLVALLSRDVTLEPGDVIACGTSVGVGTMKPGSAVTVAIAGIGELANRYE
jgi:2-keto-4-pentenoate hydratase/2-oxohepta-3-ene-1,7-dioic acid hydratase in catechol pathway